MTSFGFEVRASTVPTSRVSRSGSYSTTPTLSTPSSDCTTHAGRTPASRSSLPATIPRAFAPRESSEPGSTAHRIFGFLNLVTRPAGGFLADLVYRRWGVPGKKWLTLCLGVGMCVRHRSSAPGRVLRRSRQGGGDDRDGPVHRQAPRHRRSAQPYVVPVAAWARLTSPGRSGCPDRDERRHRLLLRARQRRQLCPRPAHPPLEQWVRACRRAKCDADRVQHRLWHRWRLGQSRRHVRSLSPSLACLSDRTTASWPSSSGAPLATQARPPR